MNVAVIGTGYVGLVAGSCFADSGHDVICVDKDASKIQRLSEGRATIYEPGLPELLERNLRNGRLRFTTDLAAAVRASSVLFIAVGTPQTGGEPDLTEVDALAGAIAPAIDDYKVIVMKSTVPVGTTERVGERIRAVAPGSIDMVSNPEFLKEGAAVEDFMKPDRVIIGAGSARAAVLVRELHAPFVRDGSSVLVTDIRTAEMTKYASNAFLATKISFMNELANLCERTGADVDRVREGMGRDARIGASFLFAGVGFGGSCLPKDVEAMTAAGRKNGYPLRILEAVRKVNAEQPRLFLDKVRDHFGGALGGRRIAVWGLAFKPRTDDMREAPSVEIVNGLLEAGAAVAACDPAAMDTARAIFGSRVDLEADAYACLADADALCVVTEWPAFRDPDFQRMKTGMRSPVVFDGRNVYSPDHMRDLGFTYYGVGRR